MGVTGILITGGYGTGSSVEVFIPSTGSQCSLPDLPGHRALYHIQAGNTLCGGGRGETCYTWHQGKWRETIDVLNLQSSVAETLEDGILVLGGDDESGPVDTILFLDKDLNVVRMSAKIATKIT